MFAFMKMPLVILVFAAIIFLFPAPPVFGSSYEKGKGRDYELKEKYENEFYGTIEKLPDSLTGIWTISGRQVSVSKDTYIDEEHGKARVGAYVEVKGRQDGKAFKAYKIEIKRLIK